MSLRADLPSCNSCPQDSQRFQKSIEKLKGIFKNQTGPTASQTTSEEPGQVVCARCSSTEERLARIEERLARIEDAYAEILSVIARQFGGLEKKVVELVEVLSGNRGEDRSYYTPAEFAAKLVKDGFKSHLTARTVRKWCSKGRINAETRSCGRGIHGEYMISASEFDRYINHGLLPATED